MSYYIRKNGVTKKLAVIPEGYPAELIGYDNTGTNLQSNNAQDAITELDSGKVSKSGDTMTGALVIERDNEIQFAARRKNTGTTSLPTTVQIGNNIADGTVGCTSGRLRIYGKSTYRTDLGAANSTANRSISLPDADGTLALTSDIPSDIVNISKIVTAVETPALNIILKSTSENIIHCLLISNLWDNKLTGCYVGVIQIRKNNNSCAILDLIPAPNTYVKPVPTYDNSTNTLTLTFDNPASRLLTLYYG